MSCPPRLGCDAPPHELLDALRRHGAVAVVSPSLPPDRLRQMLADARRFFALAPDDKRALDIAGSPHFRGYSEMCNARDYREQLHLGRELPPAGRDPAWLQLEGPNRWPEGAAELRARTLGYLDAATALAVRLLETLRCGLGLAPDRVPAADPYVLLKWIRYRAQPDPKVPRPGVAAHVDFSWLTLTLADDVGGLEVRDGDGVWRRVAAAPDALLVHVGELLQFVSAGELPATPHRVVNRSGSRARVSLPLFLCPNLRSFVPAPRSPIAMLPDAEHVHRVLPVAGVVDGFRFGAAEWRRKGENRWCALCTGAATG